jgi:hypothetical protein
MACSLVEHSENLSVTYFVSYIDGGQEKFVASVI